MDLDEQTRQRLEILIARKIEPKEKVTSLANIPGIIFQEIAQLASKRENFLFSVLYLRYISNCSLAEAVGFLNENFDVA